MSLAPTILQGLDHWQQISADARYQHLAPLPRLITAVRDRSSSAEELLEMAFALCEANLEIGRQEYAHWQGLCVLDATCVFSAEGLGGDLCRNYGYDFWAFLRAMADLARRSKDPAQYHQCINHNLFTSPADDELVLNRFQSLLPSGDLRNLGCMVDTGKLLTGLVRSETVQEQAECPDGEITITPRSMPAAYSGYGRRLKMKMDGQVVVKGPFCLNVCLERPFLWLAGVNLASLQAESSLLRSSLLLSYAVRLDTIDARGLRLLLATTAAEPSDPGRGDRHFWLHRDLLPLDGSAGVEVSAAPSQWEALSGHKQDAYGLKCRAVDPLFIDRLPVQLVLVLEDCESVISPLGEVALPSVVVCPLVGG